MKNINIIAAISDNNCIGINNNIPWRIPEDFKRVKRITTNKVIVMGKNTWESLPQQFKPLKNRTNIVLAFEEDYKNQLPESVEFYTSLESALLAHKGEEIFGFGGASIYRMFLEIAETLFITRVHRKIENCDVYFPEVNWNNWQEVEREEHDGFTFLKYVKK